MFKYICMYIFKYMCKCTYVIYNNLIYQQIFYAGHYVCVLNVFPVACDTMLNALS